MKRGGQVLAGLLQDFSEVERAMGEIEQSAGSADKEMGIIEESFDYKINALKETWVGFLTELADRGALADLIDALVKISEVLTNLLSQENAIAGLFSLITGAFATKKEIGIVNIFEELNGLFNRSGNSKDYDKLLEYFTELINGSTPEIEITVNTEQAQEQLSELADVVNEVTSSTAEAAADILDIQNSGFAEVSEETFNDITGYADSMESVWDDVVNSIHSTTSEEESLREATEEAANEIGDFYEDLFDPQEITDNITEIVAGTETPIEELNNRLSNSLNMEDALNNLRDNMQEVNTVTEEGTVIEQQRQASTANLVSAEQSANLVLAQRAMAEQGLSLEEQQLLLNESQRLASESAILTTEGQRIVQDTTLTEVERQQKLEELQLAMSKEALTTESMKATIALIDQKLATGQLVTAEELAIQTTYKNILALKQQETQSKLTAAATSLLKGALNMLATAAIMFAVTMIAKKLDEVIHKAERLAEEAQKARESIAELKKTMDDSAKTANSLKKRYAELAQGVDKLGTSFQNQGSLSTDDYQEFLDISNQLANLYPQLTKGYTDNGDALLELSGNANTIVKSLDDIIERSRQLTRMQINEEMTKVWDDDIKNIEKYREELSNTYNYATSYGVTEQRGGGYEEYLKTYQHLLDLINHSATKNLSLTEDLTKQEQELISVALNSLNIDGVNFRAGTDAKGQLDAMNIFNFGKFGPEVSHKLREYFSDQIKEYEGYIYQTEDKIAQINARMKNNLVDYLSGDMTYLSLDKNRQQVVNAILNNFDISSIPKEANVQSWDDLTRWYQTNIIQSIAKIDNKEIQQKIGQLFSGEGTLAEAEDLYETIYNYLITMFSPDDPIIVYFRGQLEDQQATVDDALTRLLVNVSDKDMRQQYAIGLRTLLEGASDEFVNWVLNDLTIPPGVIYSEQQLLDMWNELQEAENKLEDTNPFATISDSVKQFNTDIKPQFDALATAYSQIFHNEDGFQAGLDSIDIAWFEGIRSSFNDIQEDLGITFDPRYVNEFFDALENGEGVTEELAHKAFNDLATAYFYSAEGLQNLNDETANSIQQMMKQMGVINADEIIEFNLRLQELGELGYGLEDIPNGMKEVGSAVKLLSKRGIELEQVTVADINALETEGVISGVVAGSLRMYAISKMLANDNPIDSQASVTALYNLARQAGIARESLVQLEEIMGLFTKANALEAKGAYTAAEEVRKAARQKAQEAVEQVKAEFDKPFEYEIPKPESGGGKDAGKEEADAYLEAFNAELENLDWLHENGYLTEKEYLDQLRILYERYFEDNDKYAKEFFENQRKYLEGLKSLYEDALSAITDLLDDEITKYEELEKKEKKVFEDEKKANDKKIKALEKVNKQLDKQIKALEKEQKAIQKQNIDPIEEQIKGREEAKKVLEEELSLMQKQNDERQDAINLQKAQYELERAMHQKVNLVNILCQAS